MTRAEIARLAGFMVFPPLVLLLALLGSQDFGYSVEKAILGSLAGPQLEQQANPIQGAIVICCILVVVPVALGWLPTGSLYLSDSTVRLLVVAIIADGVAGVFVASADALTEIKLLDIPMTAAACVFVVLMVVLLAADQFPGETGFP